MPLFQQSVVKKYLADLDKEAMQQRWAAFAAHFHNAAIQQNILNAKEEEYQEGFVRDLFVNVLGYTLNPQPDYNFVLEKKTEADSTKSDGAIISPSFGVGAGGGQTIAVIELKDTAITDLDKVEKQAFGYKHRHRNCIYVITANFQKLCFYINDAIEYEEFELFTLTRERFDLLYLCLGEQHIFKNIPLLIKQASLTQEEAVTKKLYADYSGFRKKLFYNITELNPQYPKIELFKKTQKLLDRFLFILFAEDRMLLPPNSIREILKQWQQLKELDAEVPLYERFKKYFGYLNTGYEGKQHTIFAYNGGLFAADEILDTIKIDDTILYDSCFALSNYDFQTEIDVNILGHIFEHSLNEIEELQAEAEGKPVDKAKTKRKKDGVFYTPRYITKYIVANTVGALCEQKKNELQLQEEEYAPQLKKKDQKQLLEKLETYRAWLLQLTICDPACGSGAFLNQALEFLISEHRFIDELNAKLGGYSIVFTDVEKGILENNLFGVDINEEAVEIARLSLWLRTAKSGRKLSNLSEHIKCGNSLIDDPAVAGDKAFNWQKAFPNIFDVSLSPSKAGFDVVIGNPPYVSHDKIENKEFLKEKYSCYSPFTDLYSFFYERSINILNNNGYLFFITSNSFLRAEYGRPLRKLICEQCSFVELINIDDAQIFGGAIVNTVILCLAKSNLPPNSIVKIVNEKFEIDKIDFVSFINHNKFYYNQTNFNEDSWALVKLDLLKIVEKIKLGGKTLEALKTKIRLGLATGDNNAFVIDREKRHQLLKEDSKNIDIINPILRGRDIERYYYTFEDLYLLLTRNEVDVVKNYPTVYSYLDSFGDAFKKRGAQGKHCTNLRACSFFDDFKEEKIVWIELTDKGRFTLVTDEIYLLNSAYFLIPPEGYKSNYLLCILNSKITEFYLKIVANTSGMGTLRWINIYVKDLIIPEIDLQDQLPFIAKADIMLAKNKELQELKQQLLQLLQSNFPAVQVNKKLEQWPSLSFADFLKELSKQKIKPTLPQQAEWMGYFEEQKTKALALQTVIDTTDAAIDAMVYALYGLSGEEIKIVEGKG